MITKKKSENWPRKYGIVLIEAAIFGIGVELGKDLYRFLRRRHHNPEDVSAPPPDGDADDGTAMSGVEHVTHW